jgi:type I restriction enzyme M protein
MNEDYKGVLEKQLWNVADTLRGKMNADEFRDYILGFIFYKYLSEKMELFANNILQTTPVQFRDLTLTHPERELYLKSIQEEAVEELGYFLKPEELFSVIAKRGNGDTGEVGLFNTGKPQLIIGDLQQVLNNIEKSTMGKDSEEEFANLFEEMDLNSTKLGKKVEERNEIIAKVLAHLDKIDFALNQTEVDVLGDAYEYLIGKFASGAGKKAGEFYTPQQVSSVLAKIVTTGKHQLKSVYDPTCGSGSLLLRVAKDAKVSRFYGQEMNRTTYNLARMNMIMHGVHYQQFNIQQDDTLENPRHLDLKFEAIVANPPFSAIWSANPLFTSDERFSQYGKLAPSSKADFAFVQHMIFHLAENGTMAIVLPHGVLFRSGAELHIRRYLIENRNYLDAVIGLPANIFYGTSIPTCIMVFKKCREFPDNILFVDASNDFEKVKTQNILRNEDIEKIVQTYQNRTEINKYSKKIPLKEILDNDFNLNIPRYVDTFEVEDSINLNYICDLSRGINDISIKMDKKIHLFCEKLNIPTFVGNNLYLLKQYKKGVMQQLFAQKLRFKKDNGHDFENWQRKKGNEIFENISNKNHNSDLPILAITQEYGAIPRELIDYNVLVTDKSVESYKVVDIGDYIISLRSFQGGIEYSNYKGICSPAYIILKPFLPIDRIFYKFYFKTESYIQELNKKLEGIRDGKMVSFKYFSDIELPFPSIEEQIKIGEFLNAIDKKINIGSSIDVNILSYNSIDN